MQLCGEMAWGSNVRHFSKNQPCTECSACITVNNYPFMVILGHIAGKSLATMVVRSKCKAQNEKMVFFEGIKSECSWPVTAPRQIIQERGEFFFQHKGNVL
jgi:hypothetical protein